MDSSTQLNVVKCVLSIRKSKTERIDAFFYEILSPAGTFSSRLALADYDAGRKVDVESDTEAFLLFTEDLFNQQKESEPGISDNAMAELESLLAEILSPGEIRQAVDRDDGSVKVLEEDVRKEVLLRLGYRVTVYLRAERGDKEKLVPFIPDGAQNKAESIEKQPELPPYLIPCAPVIDPVRGTPVGSLQNGDQILLRLPEDEKSPVREKLSRVNPDFDGVTTGEVMSVHKDRGGGFTILVHLSDEFKGVVSMEGNSRIRTESIGPRPLKLSETLHPGNPQTANGNTMPAAQQGGLELPTSTSMPYILMVASVALLLALLLYFRYMS